MTYNHLLNLVKSPDLVRTLYAVLYFTNQHLVPFYRLFFKIVNLLDIDLKISGFISDVNIDSSAKFCEVTISKSCIPRKQAILAFLDCADP